MRYRFMKSVYLASAIMVRWFIESCSESSFILCAVVFVTMGSFIFVLGSVIFTNRRYVYTTKRSYSLSVDSYG